MRTPVPTFSVVVISVVYRTIIFARTVATAPVSDCTVFVQWHHTGDIELVADVFLHIERLIIGMAKGECDWFARCDTPGQGNSKSAGEIGFCSGDRRFGHADRGVFNWRLIVRVGALANNGADQLDGTGLSLV